MAFFNDDDDVLGPGQIKGASVVMRYEEPLASATLGIAIMVLLWKTLGFNWIPGWDAIFDLDQYPRRRDATGMWERFYYVTYGLLATLAQVASLSIAKAVRSTTTVDAVRRSARIVGVFHTILGVHHFLWFIRPEHGRLMKTKLPFLTVLCFGVAGTWTGLHGARLLLAAGHIKYREIRRRTALCDAVSLATFLTFFIFFPVNFLHAVAPTVISPLLAAKNFFWILNGVTVLVPPIADLRSAREF